MCVWGSEAPHIPPQDLQQLSHPVEVLRLINKTADRQIGRQTEEEMREGTRWKDTSTKTLKEWQKTGNL